MTPPNDAAMVAGVEAARAMIPFYCAGLARVLMKHADRLIELAKIGMRALELAGVAVGLRSLPEIIDKNGWSLTMTSEVLYEYAIEIDKAIRAESGAVMPEMEK